MDALTRPGGCCTDITTSSPTTVALPKFGRVTITASLFVCGYTRCTPNGATTFTVAFEAPSGDTIFLFGSTSSGSLGNQSGSGTWTVAGTGRFAQVSGSGTWSAAATFVGRDHSGFGEKEGPLDRAQLQYFGPDGSPDFPLICERMLMRRTGIPV